MTFLRRRPRPAKPHHDRKCENMTYHEKEVFTPETFDYSTAQVGDYVTQGVVDDAMACLRPACMTSQCAQLGGPYSHREDPDTGEWQATYATFRRVADGIWQYCGHCFQGENVECGRDPVYVAGED